MKSSHKLFFAIPFDSATRNLYEKVSQTIRSRYPQITTVMGNREIGPSPKYSDIASFKAQNRELTKQFVNQIRDADIVIADLTHNNPNVHVELGIALMENKNVLRVTGRSVTELGFDIRNLEVYQYKNKKELTKAITDYLDVFLEIKKLPITNQFSQLYFKEPRLIQLRAFQTQIEFDVQSNCPRDFRMRDGAAKAEFEILNAKTTDDLVWYLFSCWRKPLNGRLPCICATERITGNRSISWPPSFADHRRWATNVRKADFDDRV